MSLNKYTCLLLGVRLNRKEFDKQYLWDLLEQIENTCLSYLCGEGSNYVYIGIPIVSSGKDGNDNDFEVSNCLIDDERKENLLTLFQVEVTDLIYDYCTTLTDIKLWFFDYWG